jgi:opacity protein-like surface antigen
MLLSTTAVVSQDFHVYGFSMLDYEFLGGGARARAMGGAYTAVSDDASALTWTAAGLVQVDRTQASVSGLMLPLKQKTSLTFSALPQRNRTEEFSNGQFRVGFASFVAPVRIKGHPFMASIAYQTVQSQIGDQYNWTDTLHVVLPDTSKTTLNSETSYTGSLNKMTLGFGTGLYGNISFGAAVNIYTGTTETDYRSEFVDTMQSYFGGVPSGLTRYRGIVVAHDKGDKKGFNFAGSLLYRKDKLRVALNVKTPFELITNHDVIRADTTFSKSISVVVPGEGLPRANTPALFRSKTKVQMPLIISGGLSYQVTPQLVLAADIEYAQFSKAKYYVRGEKIPESMNSNDSIFVFTLPGSIYYSGSTNPDSQTVVNSAGESIEFYREYALNLENSLQLRLGGEYTLTTKIGTIPFRGGLRLVQGPYRAVTKLLRNTNASSQPGFELGDKVSYTVVSAGTGIHWRQIWLDVSVEVSSEKQTESGTNAYGLYTAEYKRTGPKINFNFTGFF